MVILKQIRVFRIIPLLIVVCFSSRNAHAKYGGGTGNPDDPYLIYTAEQINSIGAEPNDWDKHFRLMEDIDLSAYTEKLFNIIGNPSMPFKGVFDGNNYTISNFNYSGITAYAGIFGTVESGEIRDLHLIDPNVQVDGYVKNTAPLVGWLDNGTVSNCSVDNSNVFGSSQVGGLIGWSSFGSTIRDCTVNGAVSGENRIGGIAGRNDGTIKNCHFSGEVSATES